jgi:hypothetical protein
MLSTKINDAILSEMKTFFDMSEEKYPDLSSKDLYNDLVVFFEVERKATISSPKKEKKKSIVAEVPDDERCLALKKDGGRCNTKKSRTDMSGLCSLHKRSGPNYGVVAETTDVEDIEGVDIEGIESAVEQSESEPMDASAEIVVPPAKAKKTSKGKGSPKVAATVADDPDQIEISPKKKTASKRKMPSTSKADKVSSSAAKCCFVYGEGTNVGKECGRKTESSDKDLCKMHLVVAPKEESEDDEEISHAFVEDLQLNIQDSDCEQYVKSDDD